MIWHESDQYMGGIHYTYAKWVTHIPHRLLLDNVFFFLVPFRIVHNFKLVNHLFVKLFISKIFRSCLMFGDGNKKKQMLVAVLSSQN